MKRNLYALYFKRAIDLIVGLCMLFVAIAVLPVTLLLILLVKLDSPQESVIFTQERTGKNCLSFKIYKLRSMHLGKEISSLGRVLRRTKVDEYPQFINILKGDMSLIGPRPMQKHRLEESFTPDNQKRRMKVKPGLIPSSTKKKLKNDLTYVPSLKNDLIILLTVLPTYFLQDHG